MIHSLIGLIKLMGPLYITPVRVKLMGILRCTHVVSIHCDVVKMFITELDCSLKIKIVWSYAVRLGSVL